MAGVKGMKGGGGSRPGSGRKKKNAVSVEMEPQPHGGALKRERSESVPIAECDMLTILMNVALGKTEATALQVRAAIAAVQYTHTKRADGGKKEEKQDAAKKANSGKFAASSPPKLVVNNYKQA